MTADQKLRHLGPTLWGDAYTLGVHLRHEHGVLTPPDRLDAAVEHHGLLHLAADCWADGAP